MGAIGHRPRTGYACPHPRQLPRDRLVKGRQHSGGNGQDMPEIRNWRWTTTNPSS